MSSANQSSKAGTRGGGRKRGGGDDDGPAAPIFDSTLSEEAQRRYLHYALSVITSRALPDVRDGLKPVQRRILYAMRELGLRPDAKYRKCALIVGEVLGKYHPHGDVSVYDALVRLAQDFSMSVKLVDGRGNFGSADGDAAAAYRYTEAKLQFATLELLDELDKGTVLFRSNFDNTKQEPTVLPARFPNLLVNGSYGIAVGMATSIPPHNLGEVIDASIALIDDPDLTVKGLTKFIKGPDFPTGGQLLSSRAEMQEVYSTGSGSMKLRGEWSTEDDKKRGLQIVIESIPYAVERRAVVEKIAEVIISKKLPLLLDVRDESTHETRVVLEIKRDADPQLVMAYLYKHTPLATNVQVNLTCLIPTDNPQVPTPERLDLRSMLTQFLKFRFDVVTKRTAFDLEQLRRRIHVLEGFAVVFDALDETIRIIRKSQGKKDAAEKLVVRFKLDAEQVDAILELRLYRLAQLEINLIREELGEKGKEASRLASLLKSEPARWKLIRIELEGVKAKFAQKRRTKVGGVVDEPEYDAEAFIVDEDATVILTQQGWLKRQREVKDLSTVRVREGDQVIGLGFGSTKSSLAFFSNLGTCYVGRIVDVPATTGYGDPVQKLFKMTDGERIVAMMSFDSRVLLVPSATDDSEPEPPYAVVVTKTGQMLRFSLRGHREPSTRAGRKYARLSEGDEVVFVGLTRKRQHVACATRNGLGLATDVEEAPLLSGAGKGIMLIKLHDDDAVVGGALLSKSSDDLVVETDKGKQMRVSLAFVAGARASRGEAIVKRSQIVRVVPPEITLPEVPS